VAGLDDLRSAVSTLRSLSTPGTPRFGMPGALCAVFLGFAIAACGEGHAAAVDSARADSIALVRQDSINRAQPGYVVDSILPMEEQSAPVPRRAWRKRQGTRGVTVHGKDQLVHELRAGTRVRGHGSPGAPDPNESRVRVPGRSRSRRSAHRRTRRRRISPGCSSRTPARPDFNACSSDSAASRSAFRSLSCARNPCRRRIQSDLEGLQHLVLASRCGRANAPAVLRHPGTGRAIQDPLLLERFLNRRHTNSIPRGAR
jgi:hypothetical protein